MRQHYIRVSTTRVIVVMLLQLPIVKMVLNLASYRAIVFVEYAEYVVVG